MKDIDEVQSIIDESGNSFHCKVIQELRTKGWYTQVSPYYMDYNTNKPREIDLIAEKSFLYEDSYARKYGYVNIQLFIECKYIPQKVVFWFDNKDLESTKLMIKTNTPLRENNSYFEQHSYIKENRFVAKLFSTKSKQSPENEPIYKALNQSLNSLVYLRSKGSILPPKAKYPYDIICSVSYPVIICNSFNNFYQTEMFEQSELKKINHNFQLEVNYAYLSSNKRNVNEFFLIDIIDFNKIEAFLQTIQSDVETIKVFL